MDSCTPGIRICSAQISSIWENPEKTLEKAAAFVKHAAYSGASLICFPEQFATGWDPGSDNYVDDIDGIVITTLRNLAVDNQIGILGSFRQRNDPLPKNTAVAIGNDGRILTSYSKIHLFSPGNEQNTYFPGTNTGIFAMGNLMCGIAICYDLRFPELFRFYRKKGVQAMLIPAAWPSSRIQHWELFIAARAAENQMYIIGVNTTGKTPVGTYAGSSITADPRGIIISRANETEQLLFSDVDPSLVERVRHAFPVEIDRKDELFLEGFRS